MQKTNFVLLNLLLSSNLPAFFILNWNKLCNVEDSLEIMAFTGITYIFFLFINGYIKLDIFSFFNQHDKFFKCEAEILHKLEFNKKFRNNILISIFIIDIISLMLNLFLFQFLSWNFKIFPFWYCTCMGGTLICYLAFLSQPWLKSRFKAEDDAK